MGLGAALCHRWASLWLEIGLLSEDQPLRIPPGSDKQTLANGRFEVVPSSAVWTGPTSEGEKEGGAQPETRRQCGGQGRQRATHRPAPLPQSCRPLPAHPAGRHVCRRVDHPVDSLTFLPEGPPLEVKGVGRKASGRFCRQLVGK